MRGSATMGRTVVVPVRATHLRFATPFPALPGASISLATTATGVALLVGVLLGIRVQPRQGTEQPDRLLVPLTVGLHDLDRVSDARRIVGGRCGLFQSVHQRQALLGRVGQGGSPTTTVAGVIDPVTLDLPVAEQGPCRPVDGPIEGGRVGQRSPREKGDRQCRRDEHADAVPLLAFSPTHRCGIDTPVSEVHRQTPQLSSPDIAGERSRG